MLNGVAGLHRLSTDVEVTTVVAADWWWAGYVYPKSHLGNAWDPTLTAQPVPGGHAVNERLIGGSRHCWDVDPISGFRSPAVGRCHHGQTSLPGRQSAVGHGANHRACPAEMTMNDRYLAQLTTLPVRHRQNSIFVCRSAAGSCRRG